MNPQRKPHRWGTIAVLVVAGLLVAGGAAMVVTTVAQPNVAERTYGNVRVAARGAVAHVAEAITETPLSVTISGHGGAAELDAACGSNEFVVLDSYALPGIPAVAAAHNNCGGDVLLPWSVGQRVRVEGDGAGLYEVADVAYASKVGATVDDLVGLKGELALQTCFYGEGRMKFVGLREVRE